MESIAHDFFCFMNKLLWPLFIYYLTVPQWSWCEDQFAVLSLLLLKDIFASWTWPFPVPVSGHLAHLPLHISKETLIFTIPHTSPLCCHFTYGHTTLIPSISSFLLNFQNSVLLYPVTKALGCSMETEENLPNMVVPTWIWASPGAEATWPRCHWDTKVAPTKGRICWII